MSTAGGSARAEYERRRARELDQRRRTAGVAVVAVTAFGAVALVAAFAALRRVQPATPVGHHLVYAGLVGLVAVIWSGTQLWGRRQSTEAWAAGAQGEERTAALLEPVIGPTCQVLHDRRIPRSRANVDHLVVQPSGVVIIDSKHYVRGVEVRRDGLHSSGRRLDKVIAGAQRQRAVVADVVGPEVPVRVVLCFHGGPVTMSPRRLAPVVDGVEICSGRRLLRVLSHPATDLRSIDVAEVTARLQAALPPAS